MENTNTSTLNPKKIALVVTGVLAVIALGVFLGRGGPSFKGSFIWAENATIVSPTNVKISQDANKKFILSWDYDHDTELASKLTYTTIAPINAAAFTWEIADANTGAVIGSDDAVNDVSPTPLGAGILCNAKLTDPGMAETIDGFVCHDVFLSDAIVAQLTPGKGTILRVRAYTGATTPDAADPTKSIRQISKPGLGEFMMPAPAITPAKPVDVVALKNPAAVTGQPTAIEWSRTNPNLPDVTNTLFADHDNFYFGYAWDITDITDSGNQFSIFKKGVFDDPNTLMIPAGQPLTDEATLKQCYINPSNFSGKIWVCPQVYIPASIPGFIDGHIYTATVTVYNGVVDAAGNQVPSASKTSDVFAVTATHPQPVDTVSFNEVDPVTGIPHFIDWGWNDPAYKPDYSNSIFADSYTSYFGFGWKVTDVTVPGNETVIFNKNVFDDPGTLSYPIQKPLIPVAMAPFTSEATARQVCLMNPNGFTGKKIWTCKTAYIPAMKGFIDGHSYTATVSAYNGVVDAAGNQIPSASKTSDTFVVKSTPAKPLDYVSFSDVDQATGIPGMINWNWGNAAYVPNNENSKFADNFNSFFGFGWDISDVTVPGKEFSVFKKGVYDDSGKAVATIPSYTQPFTSEAMARKACLLTPNGYSDAIWTCSKTYVPVIDGGFINGHTYKATANAYNGAVDAAGKLIPSGAPVTSEAFVKKSVSPGALDNLDITLPTKAGDPVTLTYGWTDRGIEPSATTTTFKDAEGNYQFVYNTFVQDFNDNSGKAVWHNNFGIPPSQYGTLITGYAPPKPTPAPMAGYESCLTTVDGVQAWVCQKGYIPSEKLIPGKTYMITVNAFSSLTDSAYAPYAFKTFVMPNLAPVISADSSDTTAPTVTLASSLTQNKVKIVFSEPVKLVGTTPEKAFSVQAEGAAAPIAVTSATLDPADPTNKTVILVTGDQKTNTPYNIVIGVVGGNSVTDTAGNFVAQMWLFVALPSIPVLPVAVPPTMTLKDLSVKKLSDGNVVVTYTVDLGGKFIPTEFSSEVRLNDSKTFVARFTEAVKTDVKSYTYEAVLLPWEIKSGDTVKVVMGANGFGASNYINDGQTVTYVAAQITGTGVVGLVTANTLPAATVGSPYSSAIVVKDGVAPYKYILASGSTLPAGLSLDALTGVVSGTPTASGDYSFGLSVTDSKNTALNATFTLKIVPAPVAGTPVTTGGGGTTIINNYTTYNPAAPVAPIVPVTPVAPTPSNRFLFPINLGASSFEDVAYHWARNYINVLWNAGFVQGYSLRKFGPDDSLTRGQLLKIVMESLHYKLPTSVKYDPCIDVHTNQWYAKYFAVAREKGIIGGYVDGTCRPNKVTNRAESLKILYAAVAQMPEVPAMKVAAVVPTGYKNSFADLNEKQWYYPYFANATNLGIISGFADATARPDSELSRAQMAKIVVLMMQKLAWAK